MRLHYYKANEDFTVLTPTDDYAGAHTHYRVALDMVGEVKVSTVFLAKDHSFFGGPPQLFETMIFGGEHDLYQERYATVEEARAGHERAVAMVKGEV